MGLGRLIAGLVAGFLFLAAPVRLIADEGGLAGALLEAKLVSSYYHFARRCQIERAIEHKELLAFRARLLDALFEKYALDSDEELQVIRMMDDDTVVIATAGLSLTPEMCLRFLSSI